MITKMTQTLYSNCNIVALLMTVSTIKYDFNNKLCLESKLQDIFRDGQFMEGISFQ